MKDCVNVDCRRLLDAHRARKVFDSSPYQTKKYLKRKLDLEITPIMQVIIEARNRQLRF